MLTAKDVEAKRTGFYHALSANRKSVSENANKIDVIPYEDLARRLILSKEFDHILSSIWKGDRNKDVSLNDIKIGDKTYDFYAQWYGWNPKYIMELRIVIECSDERLLFVTVHNNCEKDWGKAEFYVPYSKRLYAHVYIYVNEARFDVPWQPNQMPRNCDIKTHVAYDLKEFSTFSQNELEAIAKAIEASGICAQ